MNWLNHCSITIDSLVFLPRERSITCLKSQRSVSISGQCAIILKLLCLSANFFVARAELINYVWKTNFDTGNKGLNQVIWQLRKAFSGLEDNKGAMIQRRLYEGYSLGAEVLVEWNFPQEIDVAVPLAFDDRGLFIGERLLSLSPFNIKILKLLNDKVGLNNITQLSSQLGCSRNELLIALGELQQQISGIQESSKLLLGWDKNNISLLVPSRCDCASETNQVERDRQGSFNRIREIGKQQTNHPEQCDDIPKSETNTLHILNQCYKYRISILFLFLLSLLILHSSDYGLDFEHNDQSKKVMTGFAEHSKIQLEKLRSLQEKNGEITIKEALNLFSESFRVIGGVVAISIVEQVDILVELGRLNLEYENYHLSEAQLSRAIRLLEEVGEGEGRRDKLYFDSNLLFVCVLMHQSRYQEAFDRLSAFRASLPDDSSKLTHYQLVLTEIEILMQSGEFEQALSKIQKIKM